MKNISYDNKKLTLLGLPIHDFTLPELLDEINNVIEAERKLIIYGFSGGVYPLLKVIPEFVIFFKQMDIIISDGAGTLLLSKLFNVPIRSRIGIPNLAFNLLELANKKKYKVYLLGASKDINQLACENIRKKYPTIVDCKGRDGYFNNEDEANILKDINEFDPDILLIGISSPIKERFALKYKDRLNTKIILPCGGVIDVLSGKVKRPPKKIERLPLTWLIRFIQEPGRLYNTSVKLVLQLVFYLIPVLYFKHLTGIERNPSIIKFHKIVIDQNIDYSERKIR